MNKNFSSFPLYRKYPDSQTYFKIESPASFQEIKRMGKYFSKLKYQSQNHADRVMIHDMIHLAFDHYLECPASEFDEIAMKWSKELLPYQPTEVKS